MSDCRCLAELLPSFWDELLTAPPPVSYQTGIIPVRRGEVVLVGAPPGAGKSALVMGMTFDALAAYSDLSAVVANVEMSWRQLCERELSRRAEVPLDWILSREFRGLPDLLAKVRAAQAELLPLAARLVVLGPPVSLEGIDGVIDATDARWIVLDYVQRIPVYADPKSNPDDARQALNQAMTMIRGLADQGRAVVAVSAINRGSGKEAYANPTLGSFRESSELEFGADAAYTLNREEGDGGGCLLKCHKARSGKRHDVPLAFQGEYQRFTRLGGASDA